MKVVINTPAGNIGRLVTDKLLAAGHSVVIISRNAAKVSSFVSRGARLVEGSIDDPNVLDLAFLGADALFWLTPFAFDKPDYITWAKRTGEAAAVAAKRHRIQRVVVLSSLGAQSESGVGPIGCLPAIESAFNASAPDVTILRPGSFMENFLMHIGSMAAAGSIFSPHPSAAKIPMVATRDIADKVVEALEMPFAFGRRVVGVHGPEDLTYVQAAQIIGEGIGRPIKFVEVTVDQAKQGMSQAGLPEFVVNLLGDMYTGYREGRMVRAEARTPETTTRTSLLEYARTVLKPTVDSLAGASTHS